MGKMKDDGERQANLERRQQAPDEVLENIHWLYAHYSDGPIPQHLLRLAKGLERELERVADRRKCSQAPDRTRTAISRLK